MEKRIIIIYIWDIFWAYWILSAIRTRLKVRKEADGQQNIPRLLHLFFVVLSFFLILFKFDNITLWNRVITPNSSLQNLGMIIVILSLSFAIWARIILGKNWSGAIQKVECQRLVISGPYRYIRNPIYTGILCGFCGTFLVIGTLASLIGFLIITVAYVIKVVKEQKFLVHEFGKDYEDYIKGSWALIPFIF